MNRAEECFKEFNKKYKEELFTVGTYLPPCDKIPFSSPTATRMLYGGLPRGRIVEFCGEDGGGKTTSALDIVANAQRIFEQEWNDAIRDLESRDKLTSTQQTQLNELREVGPKRVMWVDHEHTFDEEWSVKLGVDPQKLYFFNPSLLGAEVIFDMILSVIDTGNIGLCVLDSIGSMVSQQEMDGDVADSTYGGISRALTKFSKKAETVCARTNCMFIGINQVRDNLNAGYGGPLFNTPGGKCWKHACSVRLMYRAGKPFDTNLKEISKSAENPYGHSVMISLLKTKVCKPDRKLGMYSLSYENGILYIPDMISVAIKEDIIHKAGGWFTFIDPETGELLTKLDENGKTVDVKVQGEPNIGPFLQLEENAELFKKIKNYVNEKCM